MNMEIQKPKRRNGRRRLSPDERREAQARREETARLRMATYTQLREAMTLLSGLPRAKDVAEITRLYDRSSFVKRRIGSIAQWMKDFEHAWNSGPSDDDQTQ